MPFLHGDASASIADKFHRRQFVFAYMGGFRGGFTAEAAFCFVAAGIAQVSRIFGYCTTVFTCMSHNLPPFTTI
jgi:hypothetical protein